MVISEFESKEHEILNGVVARIDPRSGHRLSGCCFRR